MIFAKTYAKITYAKTYVKITYAGGGLLIEYKTLPSPKLNTHINKKLTEETNYTNILKVN